MYKPPYPNPLNRAEALADFETAQPGRETKIHPTAIVHPKAQLGEGVEIGPFTIVGENVVVGDGTRVGSSVILDGWTVIGKQCQIYPFAIVGMAPQDLRYKGERSWVRVGDRNVIREFVTIHRAYEEDGETRLGHENLIMAYVHIAHNCLLGNQITIANMVNLAGHVTVEDQTVIGGMAGVHQFVRVGRLAMVGGLARVVKDIPPFAMVAGQPARIHGLNFRGLKRRSVPAEARRQLKAAFRVLARSGLSLPSAIDDISQMENQTGEVQHLIRFLRERSRLGVLIRDHKEKRTAAGESDDEGMV